ncbi:hypothetical protein ACFQV2_03510 [Actinokineospora soli]|uniref:Uncharacterized protein n=1 Tax=Actinokineospora soli TaxID=1048753 RepID=A0ABW2TJ41_9PSEU
MAPDATTLRSTTSAISAIAELTVWPRSAAKQRAVATRASVVAVAVPTAKATTSGRQACRRSTKRACSASQSVTGSVGSPSLMKNTSGRQSRKPSARSCAASWSMVALSSANAAA